MTRCPFREIEPSSTGLDVEVKNTFVHFSENLHVATPLRSRSKSSPPELRDAAPAPLATEIASEFATAAKHNPSFVDADEDSQGSTTDGCGTGNADPSEDDTRSVTTLMLRNIPCRCKTEEVIEAITKFGFEKAGVFFYMPVKTNTVVHKNLGYAFVGFPDAQAAETFRQSIDGQKIFPERSSSKIISVMPAHAQGLDQTVQRLKGGESIWFPCSMTISSSRSAQRKQHANSNWTRSNVLARAERASAVALTCGAGARP